MEKTELRPFDAAASARYRAAGWWRDEVLADWVGRHAQERGTAPALIAGDVTTTWAELERAVDTVASGLAALGYGRGDVLAVQLPNSAEFILAFLAITRLGGVLQTVHMPYRADELRTLLQHSGAKGLVCLGRFKDYAPAATALELRADLPALEHVFSIGECPAGARLFNNLRGTGRLPPRPAADDAFVLLYTSGTTSSPKGVPHRYQCFMANARVSIGEFGLGADDRILSAAPFSHLYGLFSLHLALASGAAIVLLPAFAPADFAALVERSGATALFTAPAHCAACIQAGLMEKHDFNRVRFAVISGSPCAPELAAQIDAALPNGEVQQLWGMTELQAGSYTRPGQPPAQRHRTIGPASPGTELRIDGPLGGEGELQVRGASVFSGYYRNAEADQAAFTADGWFRTGDLALLDAAGCLVITGRLKDVINRGGVKFNPADVEAAIGRLPAVALCAIAPLPDPVLGERACAYVQVKPGKGLTLPEIQTHLDALGIAKNRWPEQLELVESMPLTPTNKVIKAALRPRKS